MPHQERFHRRRLALPSPISSTSPALNSTSPHNSSNLPSSLNSPVKGEQDEKIDKSKTDTSRTEDKNKTQEEKTQDKNKKVEILLRDAFGTFKVEVPYYSARVLSIPEVSVPGLKELDEKYEECLEGGENK